MKRTDFTFREFILLMLTGSGIVAVLPFTFIRFVNGEWLLFALDTSLVIGLAGLSLYVIKTHDHRIASIAVCLLCQVAIVGTIYIAGIAQLYWMYPAVVIAYYLLRPSEAIVTNLLAIAIISPQLFNALNVLSLTTVYATLAVTIAFSYAFSYVTEQQRRLVQDLAAQDPLTGAGNRRALRQRLTELVDSHQRNPISVSIMLIDLDHFKRINDDFGHAVGDDTLIGVVALLKQRLRTTDRIYRFGGEEFVIVAENAGAVFATTLAEELRALVAETPIIEERQVTLSVGVAQLNKGESTDDWLKRADVALYNAKNEGRNQTVCAPILSTKDGGKVADLTANQRPA
ncbi:MAG: GGDEF domain-containing protein [Pseudomonadota bacterium]